MLILSRNPGESIRINEYITVEVLTVKGRRVRIGISAPPEVIVDREEIYQLKRQSAASSGDPSQSP